MMTAPEQINSSEAAKILGVSQAWVAALCRAKSLKAERGSGQGSPWRIEKSSVDELAAQREKVSKEDLEDVAGEIEDDKSAGEFAKAKADESFLDRVLAIAKKYGFGTSLVVAGVVGQLVVPGNIISPLAIAEGLRQVAFAYHSQTIPSEAREEEAKESLVKGADERRSEKAAEGPPEIDARTTDEVMAAFRQATRGRGAKDREELLKEVSVLLGYKRLGPRIAEALRGHLRAAIRRKIIEVDGAQVRAGTTTMTDYTLDDLREAFASVMRIGTKYEREDVTRAIATYLGFSNLTNTVQDAMRSAFNSGIRQGVLSYEGNVIWRES